MFCPKCGKSMPDAAMFCSSCGHKFEKSRSRKRISTRTRKFAIAGCCVCLSIALVFMMTGGCILHDWEEATCIEPQTCNECGKTKGEALGHTWEEATCIEPQTCNECGKTKGEALGHDWLNATCTAPQTCSRCSIKSGEIGEHSLNRLGECIFCKKQVGVVLNMSNYGQYLSVTSNKVSPKKNVSFEGLVIEYISIVEKDGKRYQLPFKAKLHVDESGYGTFLSYNDKMPNLVDVEVTSISGIVIE